MLIAHESIIHLNPCMCGCIVCVVCVHVRVCVCARVRVWVYYALEVDSMKLTDLWQAHWSCGLSTQRSRVQIQSRILFRDFCSNQFSYKEYTDRTPSVGRRGGDGGD